MPNLRGHTLDAGDVDQAEELGDYTKILATKESCLVPPIARKRAAVNILAKISLPPKMRNVLFGLNIQGSFLEVRMVVMKGLAALHPGRPELEVTPGIPGRQIGGNVRQRVPQKEDWSLTQKER